MKRKEPRWFWSALAIGAVLVADSWPNTKERRSGHSIDCGWRCEPTLVARVLRRVLGECGANSPEDSIPDVRG